MTYLNKIENESDLSNAINKYVKDKLQEEFKKHVHKYNGEESSLTLKEDSPSTIKETIELCKDSLKRKSFDYISKHYKLSNFIIENFFHSLDISEVVKNNELSYEIIKKFNKKLNLINILVNHTPVCKKTIELIESIISVENYVPPKTVEKVGFVYSSDYVHTSNGLGVYVGSDSSSYHVSAAASLDNTLIDLIKKMSDDIDDIKSNLI